MPKVKLTESALRRAIQAALLREADEAPADAPPAAGVWDALPFNELIVSNETAKSLNALIERFEGVAVREAGSTSLVYRAWSQQAAKALGLPDPISSWLSANPTESQTEALIAYLKLSVIFLLQHEDFTGVGDADGWSVKGSQVLLVAPFFIDGENFYAPQNEDQPTTALLNRLRNAAAPGATIITYKSQEFYNKLTDAAFVQKIVNAKVEVSSLKPDTAIINSLSDATAKIIAEEIKAANSNILRPLRETWDKINTGTYQNNFIIPVNIPNIWQAVHNDPKAPLYTPWRASWVVCNLFNKALALPGGAFALAAMLQKASAGGLGSQGATYRPLEGAATALSGEPLNESMRIMATREDLRRIINAALSESLKSKNRQINEMTLDGVMASPVVRKVRDIFKSPSTEEAVETLAQYGRYGARTTAIDDAAKAFRVANQRILTREALDALDKLIRERFTSNLRVLKDAIDDAKEINIEEPGSISEILARPCVVVLRLSRVAAQTNPKIVEAARQILNLSTQLSSKASDVVEQARIADEIKDLCVKLDPSQTDTLKVILASAPVNTDFFVPIQNISFDPSDFISGVPTKIDTEGLKTAFITESDAIIDYSIDAAKGFADNPAKASAMIRKGAEAAVGRSVLSGWGNFKYNPDSPGVIGQIINTGDRFLISLPTRSLAMAAADKIPALSRGFVWLAKSNLIRAVIAKQLLAIIVYKGIAALGGTGSEYEDNFFFFALERLADPNIFAFSGAEIIAAGIGTALNLVYADDELDDAYLNVLLQDSTIIQDILTAALDFHSNGIVIPPGSFPSLSAQTVANLSKETLISSISSLPNLLNFTGAARRKAIADATQKIEAAAAAAPSVATAAGGKADKQTALSEKRKATVEASKANIEKSLLNKYAYAPPPNSLDLTSDYRKQRPTDSLSLISLAATARGADEIAALSMLIQIGAAPVPRTSAGVKVMGDTISTSSVPATPISVEEAALNAAIKRLYDKLNPTAASPPPEISADTASSTSAP